jgi:GH15 family glucan-1,4-alpha-glucosidase
MSLPLEQYGLIGDCQTAALVGSNGSIDWLCFPSFDSAACFAALLGKPENGRWQISPVGTVKRVQRRYRPGTLVLETDFETDEGAATLIDCMPERGEAPDVVRMVVGRTGRVRMHMELVIRFDYGVRIPWVRRVDGGIVAVAGPDTVVLRTPIALHGADLTTVADFTVSAGQQVPFALTWHASHMPEPKAIDAAEAIAATERWWQEWSNRCTYEGPWREAVLRSVLTLKALTFNSTGGIAAAPTTSLPEQLGGVRNWDYRFCWLRDATFTLYSLMRTGYTDEALAFRDWLLRAVAGDPAGLQIMYGLRGEARLTELELSALAGYENSRPVRIGNAASEQFQLDVYGEVLDLLHVCRREKLPQSEAVWQFEKALLRFLGGAWHKPDEGIWEVRGPRRHFTHSKVMAWVAFDRAVKAVQCYGQEGPVDDWILQRDRLHAEICEQGFNRKRQSFVQYYASEELDASLLMLPLVGFLKPQDQRIVGTLAAIERHLLHDGFVDRYSTQPHVDGLPPGEGSFLPCTFWYVDNLVLQGRKEEAAERFEQLLAIRNDLGLLAEEYDHRAGRMVGNFPQAFSHVGLVNTAQNLTTHQCPAQHRAGDGSTTKD